jgi:hypothetical protein
MAYKFVTCISVNIFFSWKGPEGRCKLLTSVRPSSVGLSYLNIPFTNYWTDCNQAWLFLSGVRVMVFDATFNNISVISWQAVLLVEETGENHPPVASHWQTSSLNVVSSIPHLSGVWAHNNSGNRHWLHR